MTTRAQQFEILAAGVMYNGSAITTGYAKFYEAGTTTPKNAYEDKDKAVSITQKALDAQGRAEVFGDGIYKIRLYEGDPDAGGVLRIEIDNYKCTAVIGNSRTVTGNATVSRDDFMVLADTSGGNITLSFEDVDTFDNYVIIKKIHASNTLTLDPYSAQQIDGDSTYDMTGNNESLTLVPDTNASTWRKTGDLAISLFGLTASVDEINTACDGVTATAAEINTACDGSTAKNSHTHPLADGATDVTASYTEVNQCDGNSFSKDGTFTITDTGNTGYEYPLNVLTPNLTTAPGVGCIVLGTANSDGNCGLVRYVNYGSDHASNTLRLQIHSSGNYIDICNGSGGLQFFGDATFDDDINLTDSDINFTGDDSTPDRLVFDGSSLDTVVSADSSGTFTIRSTDGSSNYSGILTETSGLLYLQSYDGTQYQVVLSASNANFRSAGSQDLDLGGGSNRWDTVFCYDVDNLADIAYLDDRDDLAYLHNIVGSGEINDRNGLEIVDDNTLPDFILAKAKQDILDKTGAVITRKGETQFSPEGKPYLSLSANTGWIWGMIKQLDMKFETYRTEKEAEIQALKDEIAALKGG